VNQRPHFIVELWKRERLGVSLYAYGLLCIPLIFFLIREDEPVTLFLIILVLSAIVAIAVAMHRTSRAGIKLQRERSARSAQPWEK